MSHPHRHDAPSGNDARALRGHAHGRGHGHVHAPAAFDRAFAIGIGLNLTFVAVEALYGFRAQSLALVADAGHNLSDVVGLVVAWGAAVLARRAPTRRRTYGMRSGSILAALFNAVILLVAVAGIAWEAVVRLRHPEAAHPQTVIVVALVGMLVNGATALLFASGRKGDLNIRGAYLHMASDAGVSLGVVIAGIAMMITGWLWVDPVVSLIIAALITIGTWSLLTQSVDLALHAAPEGVDPVAVERYLSSLPGVTTVHDLHIWGMSTTEAALTVHLVHPEAPAAADHDAFLARIARELHDQFGIEHVTVQVERGRGPECNLACEERA